MDGNKNLPEGENNRYVNIAIDLILKVGALAIVVYLCFKILNPFLSMLIWGLIIAIILFPLYIRLTKWVGNRNKITSLLLTAVALSILVLPSIWLVNTIFPRFARRAVSPARLSAFWRLSALPGKAS